MVQRPFALVLLLLIPTTILARTWHILPDGTGDAPTIQAAIDSAAAGDIIELGSGTFQGNGNRDLDCLGKAITVRSQFGSPEGCVIDCGGTTAAYHRGFRFHSGEDEGTILENVTIRNGYVSHEFSGEEYWPEVCGGGILCDSSSSPTIRSCRFLANSSHWGGGVCAHDASPHLMECFFSQNSAYDGAGFNGSVSAALLEDCEFTGNAAVYAGGGVDIRYQSTVTVRRCLIRGNSANVSGGGIVVGVEAAPTLVDCVISGNTCGGDGGGLNCRNSSPTFVNATFSANSAVRGGAVRMGNGAAPRFENTIFAFHAGLGALTCNEQDPACDPVLRCCDVYGNEGGDWVGCIADQEGVNGNFSADPLFCNAAANDLTLRSDSPCLPGHHPTGYDCGLVGALGEGCSAPTSVEHTSWGGVKRAFRSRRRLREEEVP